MKRAGRETSSLRTLTELDAKKRRLPSMMKKKPFLTAITMIGRITPWIADQGAASSVVTPINRDTADAIGAGEGLRRCRSSAPRPASTHSPTASYNKRCTYRFDPSCRMGCLICMRAGSRAGSLRGQRKTAGMHRLRRRSRCERACDGTAESCTSSAKAGRNGFDSRKGRCSNRAAFRR